MTVQERFESKYMKDPSGCWLWQACVNNSGYGGFNINRKWVMAHRVAWEIAYGSIPKGVHVCHHCDTTNCVNPDHLFLGSRFDNMQDAVKKKRQNYSKRTKCKNGHTLKGNSYVRKDCVVFGRRCKTCAKLSKVRYRANRRASG